MEKRTINKQTILIIPTGGNLNTIADKYMLPKNAPIKAKKYLGSEQFILDGDMDITAKITCEYELY